MANIERINKELENNDMDLVQLLVDKLSDLQRQADRMDLFKMNAPSTKSCQSFGGGGQRSPGRLFQWRLADAFRWVKFCSRA